MSKDESEKARQTSLHNERERLIDQIRQSEQTIERSKELLRRLDRLLVKGDEKP